VGTFGDPVWNFSDPSSSRLPRELQHELDVEEKESKAISQVESQMKQNILNTWKSNHY
jgi:hypothetical protein